MLEKNQERPDCVEVEVVEASFDELPHFACALLVVIISVHVGFSESYY